MQFGSEQDTDDPRRQLDVEFESVGGSDGRSLHIKAGRPINRSVDPKRLESNRKARERYRRSKHGQQIRNPTMAKPRSVQRQQRRSELKVANQARDAFKCGDMEEGCRLQVAALSTPAGRKMFPHMAETHQRTSSNTAVGEAFCDVLRAGTVHMSLRPKSKQWFDSARLA